MIKNDYESEESHKAEHEKKISNTLICLKNNGVEMEVLR